MVRARLAALWLALVVAAAAALTVAGGSPCGVAEFACRSGHCVRLDRYCDAHDDCGDASDEPPHCSVCNRTYYGEAGVAYALAAGGGEGGSGAPRVPFLCHLTFTAGGGAHGELVQLWFDEFRVGRYEPGALDGCPDGFVQVAELGRPFTGGSWCGEAAAPAVYYSETSTLTVSVKLFRARLGELFALRLRYKFLAQRDAVVRFGPAAAPLARGAVSPGTYCTRTLEECHRAACRLQSPNYPGMYPRNVTCYWSVRQRSVPACKHAMLAVRQDRAHKMQIKRSIAMASLNKTRRVVRAWGACSGARDRLLVYDGASTDDPLLLEYCGGDWLPRVTARGPDMLVAFHSSPYAAPPRPAARGFELDVDVVFVDSDSLDYAREPRRCEFHVKAASSDDDLNSTAAAGRGGGRRGVLHAPRHTLPPNTTCTWTFHGRPGDVVWIYFASYTQYSLMEGRREERDDLSLVIPPAAAPPTPPAAPASPWDRLRELLRTAPPPTAPPPAACPVSLRLWDGGGEGEAGAVPLGRYCGAPRVCARASLANATRAPRPCAPPDGYVSRAPLLALAVTSHPGTATHPLSFALHYEFVDARLPGEPLEASQGAGGARRSRAPAPPGCARLLTQEGAVESPRNVLWFGRGGARRLRCVWRVEAGAAARVQLRLDAASFGDAPRCTTRLDAHTGRPRCVPDPLDPAERPDDYSYHHEDDDDDDEDPDTALQVPHFAIYESPWPGYRVLMACVCDNSSTGLALTSGGSALELELAATRLPRGQDHRALHFRASWGRVAAPTAPPCAVRRRLPAPGARVVLTFPYSGAWESECGEAPFLLAARGNRSVFLRVWGDELPLAPPPLPPPAAPLPLPPEPPLCHTLNRVLVYEAHSGRLVKAVCPGAESTESRTVQVFSAEWWGRGARGSEPALLVRWAAREPGAAAFAWMEVWRGGGALAALLAAGAEGNSGGSAPTPAPLNATRAGCSHSCPEIGACVDAALWCDGAADCPRGGDEAGGCGAGARLLAALAAWRGAAAWGGAAGAAAAALLLLLAAAARRRRGVKALARRSTEDALFPESRASSAASS